MIQVVELAAMRAWSRAVRADGARLGFVPTMGALHEAHFRLVDAAKEHADVVALSIYVNPTQFGAGEDLECYPRDLEGDFAKADARGVACSFVPTDAQMYPTPPELRVAPDRMIATLCGPHRPGHFEGVLTVVAKLFNIVEPDVAVFGRKDAQQAALIARMVLDLNMPVQIVVAPLVREHDGLALSSRNEYLSPDERAHATTIYRALDTGHRAFAGGESSARAVIEQVRAVLNVEGLTTEYVEAVDPTSLQQVDAVDADTLLAVAAHVGATRLIDNAPLGDGPAADPKLP